MVISWRLRSCARGFRWVRTLANAALLLVLIAPALTPRVAAQAVDCSAYDSQIWAQSDFDRDPARYAALDPDGNGVACETLPPGAAPAWWTNEIPAAAEGASLVSVTDGDTIRVNVAGQNEPVRLILIDTPETHDPNNPPECYGQEATDYLSWLLSLGGDLYLEPDVTNRDRYNRLLRYAWLDFGDGRAYLVNEVMARSGYAALATFPPDVNYVDQIREAVRFAREHGYGLWSGCETDASGDTNELAPAAPASGSAARGIVSELAPGAAAPAAPSGCDPAYPTVCIPSPPPDLDCGDIAFRRFEVVPPDPHRFDGDHDGVGCER
ncbi:MAG: thermonuclease family protein [Thermomicrobiales bacterium]|nr:thermonuclease family protein [Thermomicrobiales bacterium]